MTGSEMQGKALTFAPFEHYMLADDSVECPMCFYVKVRFSGRPEHHDFDSAVRRALVRHPLLRSLVRGSVQGRTRELSWEIVDAPALTISWHSIDELAKFHVDPQIDLRQEIGMRLFVFEDAAKNESTLIVQAHHACTDATGILQLISDVLSTYGQGDGANADLFELNLDAIHERANFDTTRLQWFLRIGRDVKRLVKFARNSPDRIASRSNASRPSENESLSRPCHCEAQISSADLTSVRSFAKHHNASVNDVLLHCLFSTLHRWNLEHDSQQRKVRIGMAINLRSNSNVALPAMNLVSLAFVNRPQSEDRIESLKRIADETRFIKDYRMGLLLCRVVSAFGRIRGGMQRLLAANRSVATSILSNLGDPFSLSHWNENVHTPLCAEGRNLAIERIDLLPPLRRNIDVVFGAVTHKGQLNIALHFNSSRLSKADAEELLARFIRSILEESQGK